jgi:riboflavin synthase alpha subunit
MLSVQRDDFENRFFRLHLFRVVLQPNFGTGESVVINGCSLSVPRFNRSFFLMQFKQEISPEILWSKDISLIPDVQVPVLSLGIL